jgi:hypothetical protein
MSRLKSLEFQRLIKELQFIESDYLYQSEIIRESNNFFLDSVETILDTYPELRSIYKDRISNTFINSSKIEPNIDDIEVDVLIIKPTIDSDVKKIYRKIVKSTHPDKINNPKLNELYLEATSAYETNDLVTLYKVSSELMIEFEWSESILEQVKDKIINYKSQISFLESTYTFKWLKSSSEDDKLKIILSFIENKLNNI